MARSKFKKDPFAKREAGKYDHPVPSREFILEQIQKKGKPLSREQLMTAFKLEASSEKEAFRRRLRAMVRDGQLGRNRQGKYELIKQSELVKGCVIGHKDGYGYLSPIDGTSDIFLSAREMRKVLHGDIALVRVIDVDRFNRRQGVVVEVVEHKVREIVGRFYLEGKLGFVEPDNKRINQDVVIPEANRKNAKTGQIVNVEITDYPTIHSQSIGRVVEVLGDYMDPGLEIDISIRAFNLPYEWPAAVQKSVKKFTEQVSEKDKKDRVDLRDKFFVTIDGEDAKDFDDAVYCEKRENGKGWRLIVAIADVSHYVVPNTPLDQEALERGNSVYFPGRVVPMLPKVLSNGLCSLNPNVDRLCLACDMCISEKGEVTRHRFYSAVIHSHARLTYNKVFSLIDGKDQTLKLQYGNFLPYLDNLYSLYKTLLVQRKKRGTLDFDTPEIKVEFGPNRKIKRLYAKKRNEAHRIIEECMLCANVSAAQFLLKHKTDSLFRIHDGPKAEKFNDLKIFLGELGLSIGGGDLPHPSDYAKLIDKISKRPDGNVIQTILLRSLSKAFYSPEKEGHFGLAYDEYTHFTSPIRRYPDLLVHRAIHAVIDKQKRKDLPSFNDLKVLGEHCSMTERRADDATRAALKWLKCEYMLDKIGDVFEGVVSGVSGFGMFVELSSIYVEGLIPIAKLNGDYYNFDPIRHRLVGEKSGKIFRLGDALKVRVEHVDMENKLMDFSLVKKVG